MTKVFIIILNFNDKRDIIGCLTSLQKEKTNIIIVDNGSTDGSVEEITKLQNSKTPKLRIELIKNKKNLGFAAGANVGIKYALKKKADNILLLNPDTIVPQGLIQTLVNNQTDIVGPVVKFKRAGKWIYDYGGQVNWWLGRPTHREVEEKIINDSNHLSIMREIDYVSGCCMLIRRSVLEKIGFLDERFFLFFEDTDFCTRARKKGLKVAVESKAVIWHKLSEGKKKPLRYHLQMLKSNYFFINKHLSFCKKPISYIYLSVLYCKIFVDYLARR